MPSSSAPCWPNTTPSGMATTRPGLLVNGLTRRDFCPAAFFAPTGADGKGALLPRQRKKPRDVTVRG